MKRWLDAKENTELGEQELWVEITGREGGGYIYLYWHCDRERKQKSPTPRICRSITSCDSLCSGFAVGKHSEVQLLSHASVLVSAPSSCPSPSTHNYPIPATTLHRTRAKTVCQKVRTHNAYSSNCSPQEIKHVQTLNNNHRLRQYDGLRTRVFYTILLKLDSNYTLRGKSEGRETLDQHCRWWNEHGQLLQSMMQQINIDAVILREGVGINNITSFLDMWIDG